MDRTYRTAWYSSCEAINYTCKLFRHKVDCASPPSTAGMDDLLLNRQIVAYLSPFYRQSSRGAKNSNRSQTRWHMIWLPCRRYSFQPSCKCYRESERRIKPRLARTKGPPILTLWDKFSRMKISMLYLRALHAPDWSSSMMIYYMVARVENVRRRPNGNIGFFISCR